MLDFFAYVDAGTGSLFFQALIGAFLAGGVIFRSLLARVAYKFRASLNLNKVDE